MGHRDGSNRPPYVGAEIWRLREERGWTVADLARASGVAAAHLDRLERGWAVPRPVALARLGQALRADHAWLTRFEGAPQAADLRLVWRLAALGSTDGCLEEILTLSLAARRALARARDDLS